MLRRRQTISLMGLSKQDCQLLSWHCMQQKLLRPMLQRASSGQPSSLQMVS